MDNQNSNQQTPQNTTNESVPVNPEAMQAPVQPAVQQPVAPAQTPSQNPQPLQTTGIDDQDAKLRAKGILLAIIIVVLYFGVLILLPKALGISALGNLVSFLAWIASMVAVVLQVSSLKKTGVDALSKTAKRNSIVLMSIDPLIGQAIYYFGLRGKLPNTASKLNKIGWKVFGLWVLAVAIPIFVLAVLLSVNGIQSKAWSSSYSKDFFATTETLRSDISSASLAISRQDAPGLQSACERVTSDINDLKGIRQYPDKTIAQSIEQASDTLAEGAKNCTNGVKQSDKTLLSQAGSQISKGVTEMDAALLSLKADLNKSE